MIGDKRKKLSFVKLGAVQLLVEILASDSEPALLIQAAAAVGNALLLPLPRRWFCSGSQCVRGRLFPAAAAPCEHCGSCAESSVVFMQIGSFAASEEGVKAVVEHGAVPQLLRALQSSDPSVVEAAVRSLKMVYKVCGLVRHCSLPAA